MFLMGKRSFLTVFFTLSHMNLLIITLLNTQLLTKFPMNGYLVLETHLRVYFDIQGIDVITLYSKTAVEKTVKTGSDVNPKTKCRFGLFSTR